MEEKKNKSRKELTKELFGGFNEAVKDKKRWLICFIEVAIAAVLLVIDLLTKKYVYGYCKEHGKIDIIKGVFSFTSVENTGASFGIFSSNTLALTIVSSVCAVIIFLFLFYSYKRRNLWLRSALILIFAGAVGNIVDRIALGYVRDFIYFELIDFAVFNFADSCLTVGTIVLIIYLLFFYSKDEKSIEERKQQVANALLAAKQAEEVKKNDEVSVEAHAEETTEARLDEPSEEPHNNDAEENKE